DRLRSGSIRMGFDRSRRNGRLRGRPGRFGGFRAGEGVETKIVDVDRGRARNDGRALDRVFKFTNVSFPRMRKHPLRGLAGEAANRLRVPSGKALEKVTSQRKDV